MSAQIKINLFDNGDTVLNGLSEIVSDDLCITYSNIDGYGHGLQSKYEEPDERYYKQMELCSQLIKIAKELKEL